MRLLFYTDLHAADQTPKSRTGDYREDMLNKLRDIVNLANEYEVQYLINGADTFDRKSAWRVSHSLVYEMAQILQGLDHLTRHLTCVGTHDVPTGQLHKLSQQPLGILEACGVLEVWGAPKDEDTLFLDDVVFHFVPARYDLDKDPSNYAYVTGRAPGSEDRPVITIAHGMIVPPGGSFFGDYTDVDTIESTSADLVLYGHPHTVDGIYKNKDGVIFCGPGSVSRRDASPYNRKRVPEVVLIEANQPWSEVRSDSDKKFKFKRIPLPSARPPEEVFQDVRDEEDENVQNERMEQFVTSLKSAKINEDAWGPEELIREIDAADVPDSVKTMAKEILETLTA